MPPTVLWFRRDLRLHDLPALGAAVQAAGGGPVLPVFVADPALLAGAGPARVACLSSALQGLTAACDGALTILSGAPETVIPELVARTGAASVHISAETTPYGRHRDQAVRRTLAELPTPVPLVATGSPYAVGPGSLLTAEGRPYQVFTPFSRAWRAHGWPGPAGLPSRIRWSSAGTSAEPAAEPADLPVIAPAEPGSGEVTGQAADEALAEFLDQGLEHYHTARDRPDLNGTSRLSTHLKFGTVHPRTVLTAVASHPSGSGEGARRFVTELCWREFYADVLWHNPRSAWTDLRDGLARMSYRDPDRDEQASGQLLAWQQGRTGYPLVDAGMRQLLTEGWMPNRVRMVTASFLVKDLHLWWPHGARHFLRHLRDGDVASNNHGWQWVAGTGTDAAPYFRVFNPVTQGRTHDPHGNYVRRHLPELAHLPGASAHEPWLAADGLAHGYPERIVDHAAERRTALARYQQARR